MEFFKVISKGDAKICDEMLNYLIRYESKFDTKINTNYVVENYLNTKIDKPNCLLIYAKEGGVIVGFVWAYLKFMRNTTYKQDIILIDGLYIDPKYRRQGVGTKLIEQVENWAKLRFGDFCLEITALEKNEPAVNLYKKLGFKSIKTTLRKVYK